VEYNIINSKFESVMTHEVTKVPKPIGVTLLLFYLVPHKAT